MSSGHGSRLEVSLNYLADGSDAPSAGGAENRGEDYATAPVKLPIYNARELPGGASLLREGFTLLDRPSPVSSLPSSKEINDAYLPEVKRLLLDVTGASEVFTFAPGLRFAERSPLTGSRPNSQPARQVHSDFALAGSLDVVAKAFGERAKNAQWKAFNVWRVLSPPPQDTGLAFCDMRTIAEDDLINVEGVEALPDGRKETFDYCMYHFSSNHRWAYFPDMNRDEVIVFQGFDSQDHSNRVAHCAFDDPTCPAEADPRVSIEVRAVALFDD